MCADETSLYFHIYTKSWSLYVNNKIYEKHLINVHTNEQFIIREKIWQKKGLERERSRESKWWSCSNSEDRSSFLPEACSAGFEWRRSSLLFLTDTHIFSFNVVIDLRLSNQNVCLANKTFKLWPHYQAFLQPVHIWSIIVLLPLNFDLAFALNTNHSAFANP